MARYFNINLIEDILYQNWSQSVTVYPYVGECYKQDLFDFVDDIV